MSVGSIHSSQSSLLFQTKNGGTSKPVENNQTSAEIMKNDSNQKSRANRNDAIWKDLSKQYDVRNATFDEINAISQQLYDAGEITLKDHLQLSFDYDRAVENLKDHAPTPVIQTNNRDQTYSNQDGQRDWITEFEKRASNDWKYGELIGYHSKKKVISILQRLT